MYSFVTFNKSLYPNFLKTAKVITIHKSGDIDVPTKYRPIYLLSPFSKIIEKVLKYRFLDFMEKNKVMDNAQYGFIKGVSTSDALSDLTGFISLNKIKYCTALSIDLKKAFDSISHDILIIKLEKYGYRGVVLKLLVSFLSNKNQYISYNS